MGGNGYDRADAGRTRGRCDGLLGEGQHMRGEGVVEVGGLPGGLGQVPAVDEQVEGREAGQAGARHVPERGGVRAGEGVAGGGGGQGRGGCFRVGSGGIVAGQVYGGQASGRHRVAGRAVAEQGLAEPQGADHVVEQLTDVPLAARGRGADLIRAYCYDVLGGRGDGPLERGEELHWVPSGAMAAFLLATDPNTTNLLHTRVISYEHCY